MVVDNNSLEVKGDDGDATGDGYDGAVMVVDNGISLRVEGDDRDATGDGAVTVVDGSSLGDEGDDADDEAGMITGVTSKEVE